jgi:hypothetical protein
VSFLIWVVRDPKESESRLQGVNPTIPARVQARSRHDDRLQSMTIGAAALGIAATGFFGYAAALTYAGTSTANAATGQGVLTPQQVQDSYTYNGNVGQGTQGGLVNPNYDNQQLVAPPTTSRHRSHAITGGS